MSVGTILLIILILLLCGALPTGGYGYGAAVPSVLTVVLVILIILLLRGRI